MTTQVNKEEFYNNENRDTFLYVFLGGVQFSVQIVEVYTQYEPICSIILLDVYKGHIVGKLK